MDCSITESGIQGDIGPIVEDYESILTQWMKSNFRVNFPDFSF